MVHVAGLDPGTTSVGANTRSRSSVDRTMFVIVRPCGFIVAMVRHDGGDRRSR